MIAVCYEQGLYIQWAFSLTLCIKETEDILGVEFMTFENLAAERLRLMGFDNRLIIDCFAT